MRERKSLSGILGKLHRTSKALAWRLLELGPFEGLVAVTRGGLVPAAIVARELEIRLIDTACMASYNGQERGQVEILKEASLADDGKKWLIVDDLVDTGETYKALRALLPKLTLPPSMPNQLDGHWLIPL